MWTSIERGIDGVVGRMLSWLTHPPVRREDSEEPVERRPAAGTATAAGKAESAARSRGKATKAASKKPSGSVRKAAGKKRPAGSARKAAGKEPTGTATKAAGKKKPAGSARKAAGKKPTGTATKAAGKKPAGSARKAAGKKPPTRRVTGKPARAAGKASGLSVGAVEAAVRERTVERPAKAAATRAVSIEAELELDAVVAGPEADGGEALEARLLGALAEASEGASWRQLQEATGGTPYLRQQLKRLADAGKVQVRGKGMRKSYHLVES